MQGFSCLIHPSTRLLVVHSPKYPTITYPSIHPSNTGSHLPCAGTNSLPPGLTSQRGRQTISRKKHVSTSAVEVTKRVAGSRGLCERMCQLRPEGGMSQPCGRRLQHAHSADGEPEALQGPTMRPEPGVWSQCQIILLTSTLDKGLKTVQHVACPSSVRVLVTPPLQRGAWSPG